jgi:N utilization substance protein B
MTATTRRKSRELAMQMLFQMDMGKQTPDEVKATFWKASDDVEAEVKGFAEDLFRVVIVHQEKIDELIVAHAKNWRLTRMSGVDRNLLRMAIGEMIGFKSTPFPIVINEALEICRRYSAPESINFLNGVLDAVAHSLIGK